MTQRFLSAAYSRRKAPKAYDPSYLDVELARLMRAMPTYVVRRLTSSGILQVNDGMILCNCTTGAITLTLGDPSVSSGRPITIKKTDASANAVTLGGTIDGVLNRTLASQNDSVVIQSDGEVWFRPMITASGSGGGTTTNALTIGTHLTGGSFDGSAPITIATDAVSTNTASTIVSRGTDGSFAAGTITATGVSSYTNLVANPHTFSAGTWGLQNTTITSSTEASPDGGTTASLLTALGAEAYVSTTVTYTSSGNKEAAVYVRQGTTIVYHELAIYDNTAAAFVGILGITWTAGVPVPTSVSGGITNLSAISYGGGWYRVSGTFQSITHTHSNGLLFYLHGRGVGSAGTVYLWDVQAYNVASTAAPDSFVGYGTLNIIGSGTISGTLSVGNAVTLSSTLAVTSAATFSSTVGVTGNFAINTNKFTVTASSGNTAVAGTLAVMGDFSVNNPKIYFTASTGDMYCQGFIKSYSPTAGIGYITGAGGTVTQATSKATAFTLSKVTGQITTANDALAADTTVSATWTNTAIAATDTVLINHLSGGTVGAYTFNVQCGAGTATLNITNVSTGNLSEALVLSYVVIKGVTA